MRAAIAGLSDSQLDTPYRPGGWTVRQLAHHVPDSHINSYTRYRLALTEDEPVIKPYEEKLWAELADARTAAGGAVARAAGIAACALGAAAALAVAIRLETNLSPSGFGLVSLEKMPRSTLARPPSCGAHHGVAEADGLVVSGRMPGVNRALKIAQHRERFFVGER